MNMHHPIKIYNGKIILRDKIIPQGTVLVSDGVIKGIEEGDIEMAGAQEINANGQYISPGFIDIHVHGGCGFDFMDGTTEAFLKIAEIHAQYGTTAMLPTTLTSEKEDLIQTLKAYDLANDMNRMGASFISMHLEGPSFAMNQRVAQVPTSIRDPAPASSHDTL